MVHTYLCRTLFEAWTNHRSRKRIFQERPFVPAKVFVLYMNVDLLTNFEIPNVVYVYDGGFDEVFTVLLVSRNPGVASIK